MKIKIPKGNTVHSLARVTLRKASSTSSARQRRWHGATPGRTARVRGLFRGCCPAPEKHRTAGRDLATPGKGQCRRCGLSLGRAPGSPPGPRPAPALTQRLRATLGLLPRFGTCGWTRPASPASARLRAGSRAEALGEGSAPFPGPASVALPASFSGPIASFLGPQRPTDRPWPPLGPLAARRSRTQTPREAPHEPHARRKLRQPSFRPESRRGGASYGYAVQSECNTRGFRGADAAPPLDWGLLPTATFDEGSRGVRAPLGQSGAAELRPPKVAAIPDP